MKHELCLFQDGARYCVINGVRRMLSFLLCCDCCIMRAIRLVSDYCVHSLQVIKRLSKLIGLVDMPQSPY